MIEQKSVCVSSRASISPYGIKFVGIIVTISMSKIGNFWRLIVGDCDYAES